MPASTLDPVNAAIRNSLSKTASETNLDVQLAGTTRKALLADIEFEAAGSYQSTVLDKLKSKYIVLKSSEPIQTSETEKMGGDETLTLAKHELYPLEAVQLGWGNAEWVVGAGMVNMGNTCYLNSTLQALFHVPALVNWLVSDKQHMSQCEDSGGLCIICAMRKTLQDSQQRNTNSIRPFLIYNKLRVVCRNLIPGRQEDAHEFLRYLVEAMEKAYLRRFKNYSEFDSRTKETTPLNQILGGYLRSAVRCLECGHVSTTFQHFQDLLLDIRKAQTLEEALDGYFSREKLDDESYHCESCQKKVPATKQFSLERAPMVLCIQLKRFSVSNNKITKHVQFRPRLELTKYARHRPSAPLVYRFVALVTHMGPTVGCGHYTAVAQAPCGNYYQFDDSMVRPISHQAVFNTNAYIMLYELEHPAFPAKTQNSVVSSSSTASPSSTCASGKAKATISVNDNTSNTNVSAANCCNSANNSITSGGSGTIAVHYSKSQQQDSPNVDSGHDKSNNKSSSIPNRNRLQLNGSRVYRSDRNAPNLDPVTAAATTSAPYGHNGTTAATSSAGSGGSSGNNGLPRHCHVRKVNGGTNLFSSSSSTSSSSDSDSEQQQRQKTQERQQVTNTDSTTLPQDKNVTPATTMSAVNDSSPKNKSPKSSSPKTTPRPTGGGSGEADTGGTNGGSESNAITSLARSCSSSSVSSLSSNVEVVDGGSPSGTVTSPSTTTPTSVTPTTVTTSSRASQSITTKLVPYDVDDDDEDDAEDEENDNADSESNSSDSSGCGGRRGTASFLGTQSTSTSPSAVTTTTTITTPTVTQALSNNVERHRVTTKATTADWQVTSSEDLSLSQAPSNEGRSWTKKTKTTFPKTGNIEQGNPLTTSSSAVGELLKMSHVGYSAPVNSWGGTRAALDKEVNEERREERKRLTTCDDMDRGRVKHIKTSNENSSSYSNPGYNRLQEFHNAKNSWNQHNIGNNNNGTSSPYGGGGGRQFYNTSGKHRNRRNNYHHKSNNYHKSNYTFRQ